MSAAPRKVFLSVSAQSDNLGDIAIRQAAIELAGQVPIVCYTGRMPASYVDALDFPPGALVTASRRTFVSSLLEGLLRGRAHVMLAPGPHVLPHGRGHLKALATLMMAVAVRASGGSVVCVGQSIHGSGALGQRIQRAIARRCAVFAVRDVSSSQVLGAPVDRCPDLALGISREAGLSNRAVLSFRGDRHLDEDWVAGLVTRLRDDGLDPVFVTQVQRDDEQHRRWASQLGVGVVEWGTRGHAEQMARVQAVIAESACVVSNRLHAVIFGLQVGATPVAVLRTDRDKVVATLGDLVPLQSLDPRRVLDSSPEWRATGRRRSELDRGLAAARQDLADLGARISVAFGSETP